MKNAIISAVVAALVASGSTYAATKSFGQRLLIAKGEVTSVAPGETGFTSASCPSDSYATGGGMTSSDINGQGVTLTDSAPAPISARRFPIGWAVSVQNPGSDTAQFQAYAVCVK